VELNRKNMHKIMLLITFAVVLFAAIQHVGELWSVIRWIVGVVSPVLTGMAIAYVLNVLMSEYETHLFARMPYSRHGWVRTAMRPLSLVTTLITVIAILALILLVIVPGVRSALITLASSMEGYIASTQAWINDLLQRFNMEAVTLPQINVDWAALVKQLGESVASGSASIINSATGITASVFNGLISLVLSLFIAVYLLAQKEKVCGFSKAIAEVTLPQRWFEQLLRLIHTSNEAFTNFITGQLIEAVILSVLCFVGMLIFNFPYPAVVSVLIGVTALVPIVGAVVGEVVSAVLILMVDPLKALLFVIFILVLQMVEGNLIYPRVVGHSVGVPGVLVLIAVVIGSNVGGIAGVLIGVPLSSVVYTLLRDFVAQRLQQKRKKESAT